MSTILYETEKFLKIRESLKLHSRDLAYLWEYPEGWQDKAIDENIDKLAQDLRNANIRAVNDRYEDDNNPDEILPAHNVLPYGSTIHLVQALNSVEYNIDDISINGCAEKLHNIIHHFLNRIVSELPDYRSVNVW